MYAIDIKYIFNNLLRTSIEVIFLVLGSIIMYTIKEEFNVLSYFVVTTLFIYYIYVLAEIGMIYNFIKNYGKFFETKIDRDDWIENFVIFRVKQICYVFYSFINVTISLQFLFNTSSFQAKEMIYIIIPILVSSILNIFMVMFLGFAFILDRTNQSGRNQIEMTEVHLERNIVPPSDDCPICLDTSEEEWSELRCRHKFHYNCIKPWIDSSNTCPICRVSLR